MDIPTPTECFNKKHCLAFVILNWLFTPIATQGYLPTMPLLVTEVMGLETTTLGYLYSTKMACNLVGCFALVPLLRNFSARKATIAFLVLRAVSGLIHGVALLQMSSWTLPLLYLRSALHGFSLGGMILSPTWIAARIPESEQPAANNMLFGTLGVGMVLGPMVGSALATLAPTALLDADMPGWNTLAVSLAQLWFALVLFDDDTVMPKPVKDDPTGVEVPWKTILVCAVFALGSFTGSLGAESVVALNMWHMYGMDAAATMPFYVLQALVAPFGIVITAVLQRKLNYATIAVVSAIGIIAPPLWLLWPAIASGDWSEHPPLPVFMSVSAFMVIPGQLALVAHTTLLSKHLPNTLKSTYTPIFQTSGQFGRVIGPLIYTGVYDLGSQPGSATHGPCNTFVVMLACFALACGAPMLFHFRALYGSFSDPPVNHPYVQLTTDEAAAGGRIGAAAASTAAASGAASSSAPMVL